MTTEQKVQILAVITTTSEAGKHFTEVFDYDDLSALEEEGLIEIDRPIHVATGFSYSQEYWSVSVTPDGVDMVEAHPEYCPE